MTSMAISERVANSSFEFIFRRAECLAGLARDSNSAGLLGDLKINASSVLCRGLGVEAKSNIRVGERIVSSLDSSLLVAEIGFGGGWTFEMWATFQNFSECPLCSSRHMASIGTTNEEVVGEECSGTSNWLFLQQNSLDHFATMKERTTFPDQRCRTMESASSSAIDWGIPVHVVFTSESWGLPNGVASEQSFRTTCWYMNGLHGGCEVAADQSLEWQGGGFYLQMLNDAVAVRQLSDTTYVAPAGVIYLVAMYNRPLSEGEILQNFGAGLENSPPIAEDLLVTIHEDGEIGDHYDTPALYLRNPMVPPLNLSIIHLVVTDIDEQEGFSAYGVSEQPTLPHVYVDSLPLRGTLYNVHGEAIDRTPYFVEYDGGGYPVRYGPDKDESSGSNELYTSFAYNAVDGITGEESVIPGVVGIYVLPKNDPPLPKNFSRTIQTGETLVFLDGSDVDGEDGDAILGFSVVEPPTHGILYKVFDNLTRSDVEITRGDRLSGQFLSYVYTGNASRAVNASHEEMLVGDHISFRLYDASWAMSVIGIATLTITSRLKAVSTQSHNDSSWICVEDEESTISVYVEDTSERNRPVTIKLTGVPEHGSLRRIGVNNSRSLIAGDTLDTSCADSPTCVASVKYLPNTDYFNWPTTTWNGDGIQGNGDREFFSFFGFAQDNGEYSNDIVQDIRVKNSNDPSTLQCPKQPQHVQAVGESTYNGEDFSPLDRIAFHGFSVVDPDKNVDLVKAMVTTRFGFLTLNKDFVNLLDFNSVAYCCDGAILQCHGTGTSDRSFVFVAEPRHVQVALNGMTYQSVASNVVDDINVTILDGADGDCLSEDKFPSGSLRHQCWRKSCQYQVFVAGHHSVLQVLHVGVSPQVCVSVILGFCVLLAAGFGRCLNRQ